MSARDETETREHPYLRLAQACPILDEDLRPDEPANLSASTSRPREIVELDGIPMARWRIEPEAVYLWKGRLWRKEPVGCVLCVEMDDNHHLTFASADSRWASTFICMQHGELCEVGFELKKRYEITLDGVVREGEEILSDTMLFPAEMTLTERAAMIERLLDEAQDAEAAAGPVPTD